MFHTVEKWWDCGLEICADIFQSRQGLRWYKCPMRCNNATCFIQLWVERTLPVARTEVKRGKGLLPLKSFNSASMIGMSLCSALVAAFIVRKYTVALNLDFKMFGNRRGAACHKVYGYTSRYSIFTNLSNQASKIFSDLQGICVLRPSPALSFCPRLS